MTKRKALSKFYLISVVVVIVALVIVSILKKSAAPNTIALLREEASDGVIVTQTETQAKLGKSATVTNTKTGQKVKVKATNEKDLLDRVGGVADKMKGQTVTKKTTNGDISTSVPIENKLTDKEVCEAQGAEWVTTVTPNKCVAKVIAQAGGNPPTITSDAGKSCKGGTGSVGANQWAPTGYGLQANGQHCTAGSSCTDKRECIKCNADGTWGEKGICGSGNASNYVAPSYESEKNGGDRKSSCWKNGTWYADNTILNGDEKLKCSNGNWGPYVATPVQAAKEEVLFTAKTCVEGYSKDKTSYTKCNKDEKTGELRSKTSIMCFAPKVFQTSASGQVECVGTNNVVKSAGCMTASGNKQVSVKYFNNDTKREDVCSQGCNGSTGLCNGEINSKGSTQIGGDTNNASDCQYGVAGPGQTAKYHCNKEPVKKATQTTRVVSSCSDCNANTETCIPGGIGGKPQCTTKQAETTSTTRKVNSCEDCNSATETCIPGGIGGEAQCKPKTATSQSGSQVSNNTNLTTEQKASLTNPDQPWSAFNPMIVTKDTICPDGNPPIKKDSISASGSVSTYSCIPATKTTSSTEYTNKYVTPNALEGAGKGALTGAAVGTAACAAGALIGTLPSFGTSWGLFPACVVAVGGVSTVVGSGVGALVGGSSYTSELRPTGTKCDGVNNDKSCASNDCQYVAKDEFSDGAWTCMSASTSNKKPASGTSITDSNGKKYNGYKCDKPGKNETCRSGYCIDNRVGLWNTCEDDPFTPVMESQPSTTNDSPTFNHSETYSCNGNISVSSTGSKADCSTSGGCNPVTGRCNEGISIYSNN